MATPDLKRLIAEAHAAERFRLYRAKLYGSGAVS
jgi:hypothetical protein